MKEIQLTITALSPLAIGYKKPGGSISQAQRYIPGTVIRGAIAAQILKEPGVDPNQPGGDFQALFVDNDAAIFSNAYPTSRDDNGHILPVHLLPSTAVSSKTHSGFLDSKDKNHGVFDTLIDRFCAEEYGQLYDPNCPKSGGRVEPYAGFYSINNLDNSNNGQENYQLQTVETRLLTRVGINRRRATAQEKVLYSIEVINETKKKRNEGKKRNQTKDEKSLFLSTIRLEDKTLAQNLADYISHKSKNWRLGGSASRGLGKVSIIPKVQDYHFDLEKRINDFNTCLKDRWQNKWNIFSSSAISFPENQCFFTLNLQSDAILSEQWRRTMVVSPAMLCEMAGIDDSDLQLCATYSSYDYRSGWNAAWGLMKDVELVTRKGAVYLFKTPNLSAWISALEKLEQQGIGERTTEGFGQVQICSKFHHIFREHAV
ncbi:MAG: CRISPR-associated RAMP protein Csx10 [Cyanobacteria bacterium P01_F01_bin.33]